MVMVWWGKEYAAEIKYLAGVPVGHICYADE